MSSAARYTPVPMAIEGAGGTPGGVGTFFVGLLMSVAGGYMLTSRMRQAVD